MAVALIAGTPVYSSASVSMVTFALPAGMAAGDYTLVSVALNASSGWIETPAGWMDILPSTNGAASTSLAYAVFCRKWQAGDPASVDVTVKSGRVGVLPVRVTGAHPDSLIEVAATVEQAAADATTITAPSVTPGSGNLAVHAWAARSPTNGNIVTWTAGAGVTEIGQAGAQAPSQTNASTMVGTSTGGARTADTSVSTTGAMGVSFVIGAAPELTTTTTTTEPPTTTTTTTEPPATTTTTTTEPPPAVLFSDDFNRADGPLGTPWQNVVLNASITGGKVSSADWGARSVVDVGVADHKVSVVASAREWPIMIFRYANGGEYYFLAWSNPNYELIRRYNSADAILATMPSPTITGITMWAEAVEVAGGTEITWGYNDTSAVFTDTAASRPAGGTLAGFEIHPGRTLDDFLVEAAGATTTTTTTTTTTVPPPPLAMVGDQPVVAAFMGDVPVLSLEAITAAATTTTTTVAATTTTTTTGGGPVVGDSILYPTYIGAGSVLQRDVSAMPLATNSAAMATYMRQDQINTGYGTAFNLYEYNFPTYVVRSSEMQPAHMAWDHSWHGYPTWTPDGMMGAVFSKSGANPELNMPAFLPIPEYALPAVGTDSSMAVYDADNDTLWEWWHAQKLGVREWHAWWGSRTLNASQKYSAQADIGSVCAAGLMGSLMQIGVGEAQNGWIDHALGLVILAPKRGYSWPARQDDGWVDDVNAPTQGQWFRLNPSFNVDAQSWHPLLKMVCRAVQTYGATCFDKGGAVAWTGESGRYHESQTGVDPWVAILNGTPSWQVFHNFPWEQTQWAPIDWGKP